MKCCNCTSISCIHFFPPVSLHDYTLVKKSKGTSNIKCGSNSSKLCPAFLNVFFFFVSFFFALENSPAKSKKKKLHDDTFYSFAPKHVTDI